MLATTHLLSGAAIGVLIGNLPLSVILALISHFTFDFLPHLDVGYWQEEKDRFKQYIGILIDVMVAGAIFYFLFQEGVFKSTVIYWAAGAAILPDIIDNFPLFSNWLHQFWPFKQIYQFHSNIQKPGKRYQFSIGIIDQLIIAGISIWILLRL